MDFAFGKGVPVAYHGPQDDVSAHQSSVGAGVKQVQLTALLCKLDIVCVLLCDAAHVSSGGNGRCSCVDTVGYLSFGPIKK